MYARRRGLPRRDERARERADDARGLPPTLPPSPAGRRPTPPPPMASLSIATSAPVSGCGRRAAGRPRLPTRRALARGAPRPRPHPARRPPRTHAGVECATSEGRRPPFPLPQPAPRDDPPRCACALRPRRPPRPPAGPRHGQGDGQEAAQPADAEQPCAARAAGGSRQRRVCPLRPGEEGRNERRERAVACGCAMRASSADPDTSLPFFSL